MRVLRSKNHFWCSNSFRVGLFYSISMKSVNGALHLWIRIREMLKSELRKSEWFIPWKGFAFIILFGLILNSLNIDDVEKPFSRWKRNQKMLNWYTYVSKCINFTPSMIRYDRIFQADHRRFKVSADVCTFRTGPT